MWYEIFKFEIIYRMKRPETYVFFSFLLLFSIFGVDFIFQGIELGLMKKNAPLVIAKTMGAITGIFMIMVSMIMGVPVLRDHQYGIESLLYINPITKKDYLIGRFLGSFSVLLFIFSGLLFGMMLGSQMSWHKEEEMLLFNGFTYLNSFSIIALPILFFGSCAFFVTGMLSKKLLVVYTQGIILFVVFLLTKAITNEYLQGILDPFSLTTLTQVAKDLSGLERNSFDISLTGIVFYNKLLWGMLGIVIFGFGYKKFTFSTSAKKVKKTTYNDSNFKNEINKTIIVPHVTIRNTLYTQLIQLIKLTKFNILSLLKETSFWAIIICGIIIIIINSVNLGTVYGVNSYPQTHFIIAELQEMSMYFFIIILLFYSGEIIWKERNSKQHLLSDATQVTDFIRLSSKFLALNSIYIILMLSFILTGIIFQISVSYYTIELDVYFFGFFVEILPFLVLYTFIVFFFQAITNHKFIGIICALIFFISNIGSEYFGFNHSLYKFGGKTLGTYSDMNGYGHFLKPYLWIKAYWLVFGCILLIISSILITRGTNVTLFKRIKAIKNRLTKPLVNSLYFLMALFILVGCYIFYNTNVLNVYYTETEEENFRVAYEKTLKKHEYITQPKITDVYLHIELYPESRSYEIFGKYQLTNLSEKPIKEVHIQKIIESNTKLENITFDKKINNEINHKKFDYTIYQLSEPIQPQNSITISFKQSFIPKGFDEDNPNTRFVNNGTFFDNTILPSIGYNRKYELRNPEKRNDHNLSFRKIKADINEERELKNARSGGDSDGINLEVIIGTNNKQRAVTSGELIGKWSKNNRNYFHYKTATPIINFYSIVSAEYKIKKDKWRHSSVLNKPVNLEIYYHKNHPYNIERMIKGMKASLTYFSENFSPYQYKQLRITEFPRYSEFAQSFPGTIPFSEALGFVLDIDDERDVDMAFYVTAHEVAHQWFGMQIEAANVQGQHFILETLSQYAAIMVLKHNYPIEKVSQFLELQKDIYNKEKNKVAHEQALALVENQDFVYYNKGAIVMYKLQELIGEDSVNLAIQQFINDWHSQRGKIKTITRRYPTSEDLIEYFKREASSELKDEIDNLFKAV